MLQGISPTRCTRYHDGSVELRQAAGRRAGRQFRPVGLHHRAAVGARRAFEPLSPEQAVQAAGGSIVIIVDAGRAPVRRLGQDGRRPERHRAGHGGGRHRGGRRASTPATPRSSASWRTGSASSSAGAAGCRRSCASATARRRTGIAATSRSSSTASASISLAPSAPRCSTPSTRGFKLPADQVDAVIAAGHDALRANPIYQRFPARRRRTSDRRSRRRPPRPEAAPVAEALPPDSASRRRAGHGLHRRPRSRALTALSPKRLRAVPVPPSLIAACGGRRGEEPHQGLGALRDAWPWHGRRSRTR